MCDTCFLSSWEVILRYYSPLDLLEISKVNWGKVNGSLPERCNNLAFGFLPSLSTDLPSLCWAWVRIWPSLQALLPIILHPPLTELVYFMPIELNGSLLVFDCMLQLHVVILSCAGTPKQFTSRYALQLRQCYARGLIFESCEGPCTPCCKIAGRTSMMCYRRSVFHKTVACSVSISIWYKPGPCMMEFLYPERPHLSWCTEDQWWINGDKDWGRERQWRNGVKKLSLTTGLILQIYSGRVCLYWCQ